ncbi:BRCT domain-containing protein [Lasiodiplodia theobromae]|uniref:BRCT domain-containing protein n=1 Tax=Lasiodiplodia theobromae TaxID=45133 RepID=UPI0015C31D72|nr:BRCT domain-containing protein [Lasiodiplodia theobromae]KAF4543889.1 BRCT domain-containing protein [Lasiodiplodia theobromae]
MPDQADQARAQSPLLGAILCCTSIGPDQREELAKWATDMGAAHKFDLTSDVTHLVVGHIDTQKYKYVAKERPDVKVVLPAWVAAVRESWLKGGETDVEKLEEEYRVPTFHGLRICITGFEDLSRRKYFEETVTANGAWGVKTVTSQWLTDSIERQMALDEALYDPFLPEEIRGKGAFKKLPAESTPLGKRLRTSVTEDGEGKRKLRRTASTKLGSQSSAIWNEIETGSFGVKQEESVKDGVVSREAVPAMNKADIHRSASLDQSHGAHNQPPLFKQCAGCFNGRIIYVYGFDRAKTGILQQHLHQNGAQLVLTPEQLCSHEDPELESGFLITPSDVARDALEDLPIVAEGLTRVNEWWVEKCLHQKKIVDPIKEVICRPFPQIPIHGFEDLIISSTSFTDYDRLHVSKVVKLMGATYDEVLKESVSVLICNSDSPINPKARFCLERSIPVVFPSWLWGCISTGERQPFEAHALHLPPERSRESSQQPQTRKSSTANTDVTTKEGPALPLYESASEDEDEGAGGAAVPDDDPVPPYPDDDTSSQSKHLQELSQSDANALRKPLPTDTSPADQRKQPQLPDNLSSSTAITPPAAAAPPLTDDTPTTNLNNTIAALLAQKKQKESFRPVSAGSDNAGSGLARNNRQQRRRQLGRAPSMTSNGSAPSSLSAQNSFSTAARSAAAGEGEETAAAPPWDEEPAASQALVWGDCEDEAERVQLIRRLGGKVVEGDGAGGAADGMRAVDRIGRVADAGEGSGARVMRKRAASGRMY